MNQRKSPAEVGLFDHCFSSSCVRSTFSRALPTSWLISSKTPSMWHRKFVTSACPSGAEAKQARRSISSLHSERPVFFQSLDDLANRKDTVPSLTKVTRQQVEKGLGGFKVQWAAHSLTDRLDASSEDIAAATPNEVIAGLLEAADARYLREEIPKAIDESLMGLARVSKIVGAMKEFSHPSNDLAPLDINRAIESTITISSK